MSINSTVSVDDTVQTSYVGYDSTSPESAPGSQQNCIGTGATLQIYGLWLSTSVFLLFPLVSILIGIAICFTQRRRRLTRCCHGYPGLPSPMDFLVTPRYRWIYMALFFVMAASLLTIVGYVNRAHDIWLTREISSPFFEIFYRIIISPVAVITLMTLQFFPLFACVESVPFPGCAFTHLLGLIYSVLWLCGVTMLHLSVYFLGLQCTNDGAIILNHLTIIVFSARALKDFPLFLTGVFIVLWYLYHFVEDVVKLFLDYNKVDIDEVEWVKELRRRLGIRQPIKKGTLLSDVPFYHIQHVRCVLAKPPPPKQYGKVRSLFIKHFFPYNKYDRLPLPYLGSVAAIIILIYGLSTDLLSEGVTLIELFSLTYARSIQPLLELVQPTLEEYQPSIEEVHPLLGQAVNMTLSVNFDKINNVLRPVFVGIPIVIAISPFISTLIVIVILVHMTASVSKDIKRVAKYGLSEKPPSTLSIVPGVWKYIGVQVGYAVVAWTIYTAIASFVGIAITLLYILFVFVSFTTVFIYVLPFIATALFTKFIFYVQFLICRFVFFEDRQGKFISITNRRLFNWFAFVLFFYNGIAGIVSAILRIIFSALFGLLLLFRVDRLVLMKGFETFDYDHKKYLGFLFLYSAYNNAILHVFVGLLKNSAKKDKPGGKTSKPGEAVSADNKHLLADAGHDDNIEMVPLRGYAGNRQARTRWLLAYTLLRNPSLASRRRSGRKQDRSIAAAVAMSMAIMFEEEPKLYHKPLDNEHHERSTLACNDIGETVDIAAAVVDRGAGDSHSLTNNADLVHHFDRRPTSGNEEDNDPTTLPNLVENGTRPQSTESRESELMTTEPPRSAGLPSSAVPVVLQVSASDCVEAGNEQVVLQTGPPVQPRERETANESSKTEIKNDAEH